MATAYIRNEAWEMGVHKRKGVVYLDVHTLPERPKSELEVQNCVVIKTKIGAHRIATGEVTTSARMCLDDCYREEKLDPS